MHLVHQIVTPYVVIPTASKQQDFQDYSYHGASFTEHCDVIKPLPYALHHRVMWLYRGNMIGCHVAPAYILYIGCHFLLVPIGFHYVNRHYITVDCHPYIDLISGHYFLLVLPHFSWVLFYFYGYMGC